MKTDRGMQTSIAWNALETTDVAEQTEKMSRSCLAEGVLLRRKYRAVQILDPLILVQTLINTMNTGSLERATMVSMTAKAK